MATKFYAKMGNDNRPTGLLRIDDGGLGLYFDRRKQEWVFESWVATRISEDVDIIDITPERAADIEASFRS